MESGVECTLSKFPNTARLCGVVSMLEERDAIERDLDRLERNSRKFSKTQCKVLPLGGQQSQAQIEAGQRMN